MSSAHSSSDRLGLGFCDPRSDATLCLASPAIGDDTLQRRRGARVSPESFTHGFSAQRVAWLPRCYQSCTPAACDTFSES
ncbi:neutral zinc metallopeptidase [Brevundimonas sp. SL130]|nr:neutral zinc metallopeptidase [Brevundimonas sp. SL130]